jgi:hypothetical protein
MFGLSLRDPSEPLGSVSACRCALEAAGLAVVDVLGETIEFSAEDLALAWDSNSRSSGHAEVQRLSVQEQEALRVAYVDALAREEREHPGTLGQADVLYAFGRC